MGEFNFLSKSQKRGMVESFAEKHSVSHGQAFKLLSKIGTNSDWRGRGYIWTEELVMVRFRECGNRIPYRW